MVMSIDPEDKSNRATSWTPELEQLLSAWHRRMCACQHAYYLEAERLRRLHFWLGVPAIGLSSIVGTAVFASLENQQIAISARVLVALVSIAAAILAALQTFLRLAENAAAHGAAGDWYSAIKRDIEQLQALRRDDRGESKERVDALRQEINKAAQKSPELRESVWMMVAKEYGVDDPLVVSRPQ
jgi:hypothetical protein